MLLRKKLESLQDAEYNFNLIDRLLKGQGLDGDYIREVPALKVTGSLQAGQVVIGSETRFEDGYDPNTVSTEVRSYILESLQNLGNLAWEDAVEKAMLGATVIEGGYLVTGMIDASRIDTGTLNADRISARSITTDKITIGGVTHTNLASNSVDSNNLMAGSVTAAKIVSGAITSAKITAGAVTADKISSNQIEGYHIVSNSISAAKIQSGAITAAKIAVSAVGANKLDSTIIDGGLIITSLLSASRITAGTMTADRIWGGTLSGVTLNVLGNHNLGHKLILNDASFSAGIQWGSTNLARIYYDPGANSLILEASGGIWANSTRIDQASARFG